MASNSSSSSSSSHYSPNITQVGDDHLFSILSLLPLQSILAFSMTCRRFRSLASSDTLWEAICRRDWGTHRVDALLSSYSSSHHRRSGISWKKLYKEVSQLGSLSCHQLSSADGNFPCPRASLSLNFVSDCLVLYGGGCEGGRHLDDTWVAHIGESVNSRLVSWQKVDSREPSGRFGQSCTVVRDDALILFGGINDNGARRNDTWVGHVTHGGSREINVSWQPLEVDATGPPPRGAHAACSAGDRRIVIHGGIGLYGLRLNDTWLLDLSDNLLFGRWHHIVADARPSPPARSGHSLTWIGGSRMVLFGGRGSGYEVLNDLWMLDMEGDYPKWTKLEYDSTEMPLPRVGHSATLILGGKVLVYGGEDAQRHRKDDFWVLDTCALMKFQAMGLGEKMAAGRGLWQRLRIDGSRPDYRSFHGACSDHSGRLVYVFGGMVDGMLQPGEANALRFDGELYLVELAPLWTVALQ